MKQIVGALQPIGRALMLPIAVLPVAGLLLRLGQPDLLDVPLLAAGGNALFSSLGLLFAIGVATGLARDGNGAAALAGVTAYLVAVHGGRVLLTIPPDVIAGVPEALVATVSDAYRAKAIGRLDVPLGILSGVIAGFLYNRYSGFSLPAYLSFFGGRRFVPIISGLAGLAMGGVTGLGYVGLDHGLDVAGNAMTTAGPVGLFLFGVFNRLLLVTGLHHILNNVAWFMLGDFSGTTGDLRRFFAGDPTAGAFMAGFFPIMMFGLPAACLAMYRNALPERRREVGGLLASLAATSFLTGVTEPIEFTFMFVAPLLYVVHALLTGVAMVVMDLLNVRMGFGFSAGLFDYVLNYGAATRPLMLLPVGAAFFVVYFLVFDIAIRRFNLPTPGRDKAAAGATGAAPSAAAADRADGFILALGGAGNITRIGACTTRLRIVLVDGGAVDEAALRQLGALGLVRPSDTALQVVMGPVADLIAVEINARLEAGPAPAATQPVRTAPIEPAPAIAPRPGIVAAAGGSDAIRDAQMVAGRLRLVLADPAAQPAFDRVEGVRGSFSAGGGVWHLLGARSALID
ncbi:N-acetylglucosamine-specific PTS transporter subunit IIBC [Sphingomonas sp. BGYR3]|uniref:N-acetylglucosamine-specific PTS transporter subunit IIBC n=1 Tax=Sphingomonas sp. BGYR3 TaxID=2975483 RepID=UPI0021A6C04C|nr:N-acetylglucosamine-specific PTS transporter subunit IIBC [Sphingomonas sp. BGYR3]MDG5487231.1 N-acetylglucosamine-specific PTS transporter subunit IIBC [Sphingomonas sp. BGYR3]